MDRFRRLAGYDLRQQPVIFRRQMLNYNKRHPGFRHGTAEERSQSLETPRAGADSDDRKCQLSNRFVHRQRFSISGLLSHTSNAGQFPQFPDNYMG